MVDRGADRGFAGAPILEVRDLNVFYGASHALQGVNLTLREGVLSVVGRNGMGKTTLCKAIMGLVPVASGSISLAGQSLVGLTPSAIAQLGVGYVPQGRRLWRSLTVDEHLRMVARGRGGAWTVERVYATFPRLAERKTNGGGQLSGGEQQMLAIARALLTNPRLLVMDEPTEGLAPVIVAQVKELLLRLGDEEGIDVLVIEQNIGVATAVSAETGIMVNGRIDRVVDSATLAANRDLQQQLLGVGRHAQDLTPAAGPQAGGAAPPASAVTKVYASNPVPPTRWSRPVPVRQIIQSARTLTEVTATSPLRAAARLPLRVLSGAGAQTVLVAGTLDTKGEELRFLRDRMRVEGLTVRLVDLSTGGGRSGAEVPAHEVAAWHPRGAAGVFTSDRGEAVAGMALAFERWVRHQQGIAGILSAGGSGGTALVAPAMRALPVGVPKLIVSTVASGEVGPYVGASDLTMMYAVADIQGLNRITRAVLANAAGAMAGMVRARRGAPAAPEGLPAVALTMFGVTTPCVQQITRTLEAAGEAECIVFHATGTGGRSMERLVDEGQVQAVIDITTTEVCDLLVGGIMPATEDRLGAVIRARMPWVGSVGAVDMVNFGAMETVPERFRGRTLYRHNPQVTLMRTTPEENAAVGRWLGERLNLMEAPVRLFLPEGGVSALDAPGQPFHDPRADAALFAALEETVRVTADRQIIRVPFHINAPGFAAAVVEAHRALHGAPPRRRAKAR